MVQALANDISIIIFQEAICDPCLRPTISVPNFVPATRPYPKSPIGPNHPRVQPTSEFERACSIFVSLFVSHPPTGIWPSRRLSLGYSQKTRDEHETRINAAS